MYFIDIETDQGWYFFSFGTWKDKCSVCQPVNILILGGEICIEVQGLLLQPYTYHWGAIEDQEQSWSDE